MKATSIEQIREHLARGGKVVCHVREFPGIEAHCRSVVRSRTSEDGFVFDDGTWAQFDNSFVDHWELLPIEEENLADQTFCDKCKYKSVTGDFCPKCKRLWMWLRGELPGTDAKTPPSEERKLDITQDEIVVGAYVNRIRQSLLFGHYPTMPDLLDWWHFTTGEKIEWGRRCNACECSGKARKHVGNAQSAMVNCKLCQGSGYTVRPTWMEEVKG